MTNTQERLAALQFEITALREQLAELADPASDDRQRQFLFRELVYAVATYSALLRKHSRQPGYPLHQRAINQVDQLNYN
jgi:hypothetical protein